MRIPLTLQQMEAFAEVAKTASFREASKNLHVSQPALSRTIRMAENALDTKLFDRDTRHVELTPSGLELLPIARRILQDFNGTFSELGQFLDGRRGHITLIALPSAGVALLTPAIATYREKFPHVGFTMLEGQDREVRAAVTEGLADFGVTKRPKQQEPFRYTHWIDDPFFLLCPDNHPLATESVVPWSVFLDQPFLSAAGTSSIRPITDAAFLRRHWQVPEGVEYPSVLAAAAMVRAGLGLTAIPKLAVQFLNLSGLAAVPLKSPVMTRPIGLITRVGRSLSPAVREFIKEIETTAIQQSE